MTTLQVILRVAPVMVAMSHIKDCDEGSGCDNLISMLFEFALLSTCN